MRWRRLQPLFPAEEQREQKLAVDLAEAWRSGSAGRGDRARLASSQTRRSRTLRPGPSVWAVRPYCRCHRCCRSGEQAGAVQPAPLATAVAEQYCHCRRRHCRCRCGSPSCSSSQWLTSAAKQQLQQQQRQWRRQQAPLECRSLPKAARRMTEPAAGQLLWQCKSLAWPCPTGWFRTVAVCIGPLHCP